MLQVIDALKILEQKHKLPTEAFFVDTNIIIDFVDPFGQTASDKDISERNSTISRILNYLKNHHKCLVSISAAFEYYKHIQYGFMKTEMKISGLSPNQFKWKRKNDTVFNEKWDRRIRKLKKSLTKNFSLYDTTLDFDNLISIFDTNFDFGDFLIYQTMLSSPTENRCIFTHDEDFYEFGNDFYLLSLNSKIIERARADSKLFN